MPTRSTEEPPRVLIAGGGMAALEAALGLRQLGGERLAITIIAPEPEFAYRPVSVREPFGYLGAVRHPLADIAHDIGVDLLVDRLTRVDADAQIARTAADEELPYDALLLAVGARARYRLEHAIPLDDKRIDEQLHGLIQDIEGGCVRRLAFIVPGPTSWALPAYELALMTASRAFDMNIGMSITIVTEEAAPLIIFGPKVSDALEKLLEERGILAITSTRCEIPTPGRIAMSSGAQQLHVDRIVAIPELVGPGLQGVPENSEGGFIPVDSYGQVIGVEGVWAAGDATDFAIKLGGVAAQQADVAAQSLAAHLALAPPPAPLQPDLHAMLLTGGKPRYLSAGASGDPSSRSAFSAEAEWPPLETLVGQHLGRYLQAQPSWASSAFHAIVA